MASMVAGGLFNAFAFAGAGYLFKMFDSNGYSDETRPLTYFANVHAP